MLLLPLLPPPLLRLQVLQFNQYLYPDAPKERLFIYVHLLIRFVLVDLLL
jgi:hypothetical protein